MTVHGTGTHEAKKKNYEILWRILNEYENERVIGDMDAHKRSLGVPTNPNGHKLLNFVQDYQFKEIHNQRIVKV